MANKKKVRGMNPENTNTVTLGLSAFAIVAIVIRIMFGGYNNADIWSLINAHIFILSTTQLLGSLYKDTARVVKNYTQEMIYAVLKFAWKFCAYGSIVFSMYCIAEAYLGIYAPFVNGFIPLGSLFMLIVAAFVGVAHEKLEELQK